MNPILAFLLRLLLVLLSYMFVGWIGYTIYTDLRKGVFASDQTVIPPIILQTELDGESQSKRFTIPEITLGRNPASDFPINDETISLIHCKLSYHHKQWWVEDLDSTNGSYLNNTQIKSPVVLTNSDELRLGQVLITIDFN